MPDRTAQDRQRARAKDEPIAHEHQLPTPELYVSCDIEANGPCPGLFSMLSFGLAAFTLDKQLVGTFSRNLDLLDGADVDERTMTWWAQPEQAEAYEKSRENTISPRGAMVECKSWLDDMRRFGRPLICGAPSGFDFTFMYYYFQRFLGESPIGFASLDLRSYAAAVMKRQYRHVGKRQYPAEWIDENVPHTHVALDDAIEQGCILINMMRANLELPRIAELLDERRLHAETRDSGARAGLGPLGRRARGRGAGRTFGNDAVRADFTARIEAHLTSIEPFVNAASYSYLPVSGSALR